MSTPLQQSGDVVLCWRRVLAVATWSLGVDWPQLTDDEAIAFLYTWPRSERDPEN